MKFTQEEAYKKLVDILTNGGKKPLRMSEVSVNRQLEALMPIIATDEMELEEFIGKTKSVFETTNSNVEHDNSVFITKWNSEHPKEDAKKEEKPKAVENDKQGNSELEHLIEVVNGLQNELNESKKANSLKAKKAELISAMEKKGIKDKEWTNDLLEQIAITEDMDVDEKAESFLKLYNKSKASNGGNNATPLSSSQGGNKDNAARFDYIKREYEKEQERQKDLV